MADDELKSDFFQKLFKVVSGILAPALLIFGDQDARAELLGSLGLDPDADIGDLPSTTQLDAYISAAAEDVDAFALAGAISDLVQLTVAIEGAIRAGLSDDDDVDAGFAVDEIMGSFLNILMMEYIRRNSPSIHAFGQLISVINANTASIGGSTNLYKTIKDFFIRLVSGLETPESAEALSQTIFASLGFVLWLIDKLAIKNSDVLDLKIDFGFDGYEGTRTPHLDAISDRTLTYSVSVVPFDDPDTRGDFYNTLTFVPESHGGGAYVTEVSGVVDVLLPVTDNTSFKLDVDGDGVFRIGERPDAELGKNNQLELTFKHKLPSDFKTKVFPSPTIILGLKEYAWKVTLKPDDLDINIKSKLSFEMRRDPDAGFPANLLPKKTTKDIDLEFGYSGKRDFYFGSGGGNPMAPPDGTESEVVPQELNFTEKILKVLLDLIDLRLQINKDIGGILGIEILTIKTGTDNGLETIKFEASLDFWVKFTSVVKVSISRLGAEMVFTERDDNAGFLGYDLGVDFKAPTGAGIAVNAGPITGGGFLYLDEEEGEYYGALEFIIKDVLTLKAVGVINTIMPDGSKGFSMLVLVTGEYAIPLQFGFFLNGLGGLMGIDRTVNVEAMRIGVRTNAINSIMFPPDVVGNISRIISDIKDFFPIKENQFVVGLMARIGYGGTDILLIDLGAIVEFPDPKILILGVIRFRAPREDVEALRLQVNFLGVIDTVNQYFYFEAHLYDSHVVGIELTGSLALVVGWGDNALFALSVGGFHPDFNDYPTVPSLPGAFREMDRVGLSLLSGKNPSLTIECYFAVTSNSLQFGAKLELLASGPASFNVYGLLSFEALFIFDPFSFTISMEATLAIRRKTKILFGISFKGTLAGPNSWNIDGEVSFGFLFFDITIPVRATWGDELEEVAGETVRLMPLLEQELKDKHNWQGAPGKRLHHSVTHRQIEETEGNELIVFPFGELGFSQNALPLNYEIEQYGNKVPEGPTRIGIQGVSVGGEELQTSKRKELFAAGNYTKLTENEKLSRKSFERFDSGFELRGSDKLKTSPRTVLPVSLDYELNYTEDDQPEPVVSPLPAPVFEHLVRNASVSQADISWSNRQMDGLNAIEDMKIAKELEGYVVANTQTLTPIGEVTQFTTMAEANLAMDAAVANDPDMDGLLQVVSAHELRR